MASIERCAQCIRKQRSLCAHRSRRQYVSDTPVGRQQPTNRYRVTGKRCTKCRRSLTTHVRTCTVCQTPLCRWHHGATCSHWCDIVVRKQNPAFLQQVRAARLGKKATPEQRERYRLAALKRSQDPKYLEKMSAACKRAAADPHLRATRSDNTRTWVREHPDRLAARQAKSMLWTGRRVEYLDASGRLWSLRSSWELRFAQWLDAQVFTWFYEPCQLLLSTGRAYHPDFWVLEWQTYVEIKGRWDRRGKAHQAALDGYPVLTVRGLPALKELCSWMR